MQDTELARISQAGMRDILQRASWRTAKPKTAVGAKRHVRFGSEKRRWGRQHRFLKVRRCYRRSNSASGTCSGCLPEGDKVTKNRRVRVLGADRQAERLCNAATFVPLRGEVTANDA